jgi:glycosyltransferase involved in cell wall biosynthesis
MAVGVPVVVTDSGGILETIPEELRHEAVPEGDAGALATQIVRLRDMECSWPERARRARTFVESDLSWPVLARRMANVYEDLLA